jgi:8-amino-7-oxononanoate synthase
MDLFEKCYGYTVAKEAMAAGYYPYFIPLSETEGTEVSVNGHRMIMIGSNNYLGLTVHPEVREASIEAVRQHGTSCTGSRFLNGNLVMHQELEERLADFMGREQALVFSTGYQTNLGTISALIGRGDVVITDRDDHASIIDGCLLSRGEMRRFRHNDMDSLERILERCDPEAGKMVVVDGVFSMGGDIAPLPELVPICQKHGAKLMVDDAHSLGVLGLGRGTAAHFDISEGIDVTMGTFSKSFASLGGCIVGDEPVIHYIRHTARSLIYSASMPPANVAACLAALDIMETETWRYERLAEIATKMREGFRSLGFKTGPTETPIIPILVGDQMRTLLLWKALFEAGIYTNAVVPPGVALNDSRLRTSYMATHTDDQLDRVLETFAAVGREVGVI